MLVVKDARAAGRKDRPSHPAADPGVATTSTTHFDMPPRWLARTDPFWTLESLPAGDHRCGITSLVRQRLSVE